MGVNEVGGGLGWQRETATTTNRFLLKDDSGVSMNYSKTNLL